VEVASADVAIVGAGPAGSTLAALLVARGIAVALIDRDVFPRDKLCGEFLSYDALPILERLGLLPAIADAPRIERCRVVGSRRTYEFSFPHAARGVSRHFFDDLLFREAVSRGARSFAGWTADRIEQDGVVISHEGETRRIAARVIAGAWGRWGRFDAQLQRSFVRDRTHRHFGFKRHYVASASAAKTDRTVIDLYSFPRGYLGVNAIEGGLTNVCGLVHASRLTGHKGRWDSFVETIRREVRALETMYAKYEPSGEFLSSEPVIFRGRAATERGLFMVGDASGIIDPLAGNGMAMAMQSALIAAPLIERALARGSDRPAIERAYGRDHAQMFASRIQWSRRVAILLGRPALLNAALRATSEPKIGEFLLRKTRADVGEIERIADAWFRTG
jgi:flavin-dependent dehydrogenase